MLKQSLLVTVVTAAVFPLSWIQSEASLFASPPISFVGAEPTESQKLVVFPTAPSYEGGTKGWELCFNLKVKNTSANAIDLKNAQVVVYSQSGTVLKNVNLFDKMKKKDGGGTSWLVDDAALEPDEVVRLLMLPDLSFPMIAGQTPSLVKVFLYCHGFAGAATYTSDVLVYHNSVCSYRYPAKLDSLGTNQFWNGSSNAGGGHHRESQSGMFALDLGILRWDAGLGDWVELCPNANGSANEDYLVWNKKIYAMADGVVLDFEDGKNDHLPGAEGSGANFIRIRHGSEIASYYHFRKNTLNSALMEVGAAVSAGQFLGRIGNSGNSSHPHLHIEISKSGIGRPIGFRQIYVISDQAAAQAAANGQTAPFVLMDGEALPWCDLGERNLVYPAPNDLACGTINPSLGGVFNEDLAGSTSGGMPILEPPVSRGDIIASPRWIAPQSTGLRRPLLIAPPMVSPRLIRTPADSPDRVRPTVDRTVKHLLRRRPIGTTRDVPRMTFPAPRRLPDGAATRPSTPQRIRTSPSVAPRRPHQIPSTSRPLERRPTVRRPDVQVAPLRQLDRRSEGDRQRPAGSRQRPMSAASSNDSAATSDRSTRRPGKR
ncbi:Peptidase family M23 [Stieleria maiorica]|uniref:Peptidase family M23 n=1 Tax=Stieleria maiorica TaxID=2795974 RepID=A0A5B9MPM6_9BACT|nr:M23 family metallopeptidase [Stieleria maiorica]QEG01947.1 Peptidase family M23 [Stieleria maiorica]